MMMDARPTPHNSRNASRSLTPLFGTSNEVANKEKSRKPRPTRIPRLTKPSYKIPTHTSEELLSRNQKTVIIRQQKPPGDTKDDPNQEITLKITTNDNRQLQSEANFKRQFNSDCTIRTANRSAIPCQSKSSAKLCNRHWNKFYGSASNAKKGQNLLQVHIPQCDENHSEENLTLNCNKFQKVQNPREYVQSNEIPNYTSIAPTDNDDWLPYSTQSNNSISLETFLNSKPIGTSLVSSRPDPTRCDLKYVTGDIKCTVKEVGSSRNGIRPPIIVDENTHPVIRKIHEDAHVLKIIPEDEPSTKDFGVDPICLPNKDVAVEKSETNVTDTGVNTIHNVNIDVGTKQSSVAVDEKNTKNTGVDPIDLSTQPNNSTCSSIDGDDMLIFEKEELFGNTDATTLPPPRNDVHPFVSLCTGLSHSGLTAVKGSPIAEKTSGASSVQSNKLCLTDDSSEVEQKNTDFDQESGTDSIKFSSNTTVTDIEFRDNYNTQYNRDQPDEYNMLDHHSAMKGERDDNVTSSPDNSNLQSVEPKTCSGETCHVCNRSSCDLWWKFTTHFDRKQKLIGSRRCNLSIYKHFSRHNERERKVSNKKKSPLSAIKHRRCYLFWKSNKRRPAWFKHPEMYVYNVQSNTLTTSADIQHPSIPATSTNASLLSTPKSVTAMSERTVHEKTDSFYIETIQECRESSESLESVPSVLAVPVLSPVLLTSIKEIPEIQAIMSSPNNFRSPDLSTFWSSRGSPTMEARDQVPTKDVPMQDIPDQSRPSSPASEISQSTMPIETTRVTVDDKETNNVVVINSVKPLVTGDGDDHKKSFTGILEQSNISSRFESDKATGWNRDKNIEVGQDTANCASVQVLFGHEYRNIGTDSGVSIVTVSDQDEYYPPLNKQANHGSKIPSTAKNETYSKKLNTQSKNMVEGSEITLTPSAEDKKYDSKTKCTITIKKLTGESKTLPKVTLNDSANGIRVDYNNNPIHEHVTIEEFSNNTDKNGNGTAYAINICFKGQQELRPNRRPARIDSITSDGTFRHQSVNTLKSRGQKSWCERKKIYHLTETIQSRCQCSVCRKHTFFSYSKNKKIQVDLSAETNYWIEKAILNNTIYYPANVADNIPDARVCKTLHKMKTFLALGQSKCDCNRRYPGTLSERNIRGERYVQTGSSRCRVLAPSVSSGLPPSSGGRANYVVVEPPDLIAHKFIPTT